MDFLGWILDAYSETQTQSKRGQENEQRNEMFANGEIEVLLDTPDVGLYIPHTERASRYLGKNTRWCTAADNNCMFESYKKNGDLLVILFKKTNDRYQIHEKTKSFMDAKDEEVNHRTLYRKYPDLYPVVVKRLKELKRPEYFYASGEDERLEKIPDYKLQDIVEELLADGDEMTLRRLLKFHPKAIHYVSDPSRDLQLLAVEGDPRSIFNIKNPSEEIQLAAIRKNPAALEDIENPTERVQLEAVQKNGLVIKYLADRNPSKEVQLAAVRQNGKAIKYLVDNNPSEEVQLAAVRQNGWAIEYLADRNPSEKVQIAAMEQNGRAIQFLTEYFRPSEDVQLAAVRQNGKAIQSLARFNPSEKVQLAAVKNTPEAIVFIPAPSEDVQLAAIEADEMMIYDIKKMTPFVEILKQVMEGKDIPPRQRQTFVEEALMKMKKYPFLKKVLAQRGWL